MQVKSRYLAAILEITGPLGEKKYQAKLRMIPKAIRESMPDLDLHFPWQFGFQLWGDSVDNWLLLVPGLRRMRDPCD